MRLIRSLIAALLVASLTISASAAFTPSVEYKDAPEVVVTTDAEGNSIVGTITDAEGNVISNVLAGTIAITPFAASAKEETDPEIAARLIEVRAELEAALEDSDNELILAVAEALNNIPIENIVISDIFTITADGIHVDALRSGLILTVSLTSQSITKADEGSISIWQRSATTEEWSELDFEIDEKNVITLKITDIGEIVIFRDSAATPVTGENAPRSPQTSPVRNP